MISAQHKLLTKQEVVQLLAISISTLDRMRKRREISEISVAHAGPGRWTVRFDPEEVARWQREHRKSTDGQPEGQPSSERE